MENYTFTTKVLTDYSVVLPKYFRVLNTYYMILDQETYLRIKDHIQDLDHMVGLYAVIEREKIRYSIDHLSVSQKNGEIQPITEQEFKEIFVKVSLALEALMN
jgi:hypothetical protein